MSGVIDFALLKISEHGNDLVQSGGITREQLADALAHRRRELSARPTGEVALQLLNDLPDSAFSYA